MKERPILFSTEMVKAILDGRKSQTRRIIKKQPHGAGDWIMQGINWLFPNVNPYINLKCPYGQPGDVLWVRETWSPIEFEDGMHFRYKASFVENNCLNPKWKPSIFMPKAASRLKIKVTNIRIERLQDITEEDAKAEGVEYDYTIEDGRSYVNYTKKPIDGKKIAELETARASYMSLWDSINGILSFRQNPWIWVIEFEKP